MMTRFAILAVAMALAGGAVPAGATDLQMAQAAPGSEEARMQDCMKYATRGVCEKRIKGPAGQPGPARSEQERMQECMKYASQGVCEKRIKGPSSQPAAHLTEEEAMQKCMQYASQSACEEKILGK